MLNSHTALITGSTQGIGLAIAQALARAGADVVVHGIEGKDQGETIAAEVAAIGGVRARPTYTATSPTPTKPQVLWLPPLRRSPRPTSWSTTPASSTRARSRVSRSSAGTRFSP